MKANEEKEIREKRENTALGNQCAVPLIEEAHQADNGREGKRRPCYSSTTQPFLDSNYYFQVENMPMNRLYTIHTYK